MIKTNLTLAFLVGTVLQQSAWADSLPKTNPFLAADILAISHVDNAASDAFPYTIPKGTYPIDLSKTKQVVVDNTASVVTLSATSPDFMWGLSSKGVSYIDKRADRWKRIASADVPDADQISVINGLVDKNNTVFANYSNRYIYAFALKDPQKPSDGIKVLHKFDYDSVIRNIDDQIVALSMTYDGNLIIVGTTSLTILDTNLQKVLSRVEFGKDETISNNVAVDENNGIYVASDKFMRKVIWNGDELSPSENDGAWSSGYNVGQQAASLKAGKGTGSTPALMGFGDDMDKLVVITDGDNHMNLVAFWRNGIPGNFSQIPGTKSRRIAGQIPVTCGFKKLPRFIQSEQPVAVKNYGAFVVNNVGEEDQKESVANIALGPVVMPAKGAERFEWNPVKHEWRSVWTNANAVSTSMVPVVSRPSNIVLINGYTQKHGWEITGLDWDTGRVVHRTVFGQNDHGNGASAQIELMSDNDLVFNSIAGPFRIKYPQ